MIGDLAGHSPEGERKTVVMDAGIATEDNLDLLRERRISLRVRIAQEVEGLFTGRGKTDNQNNGRGEAKSTPTDLLPQR